MDAYAGEWLGLWLRWFHFMIGVAWIGASFYFIWLNNTVRPPDADEPAPPGVAGKLFAIHGGAFYEVTKYAGAPARLPRTLHWFKWEAYLTWITGFSLLILHFWLKADQMMVDPAVAPLTALQAVGVGGATLLGGWLVYDGLCRSPLRDHGTALAATLAALISAASFGLFHLLSARAAYIHVGAMIGTWMAANVFFVIIPGQRAMVDAMIAGTPPPLEKGRAGALRSLHNNYLTLPVLFIMISGHFPQTWGHPQGWLVLLGIALAGVTYRHWVNLDERGVHRPWMPALALAVLAGVALASRPAPPPAAEGPQVSMVEVQQIVALRCLPCHATVPSYAGFASAPKGLILEEPAQIRASAEKIYQQVVVAKAMPLGNLTGLTDEERGRFAAWLQQQGAVR